MNLEQQLEQLDREGIEYVVTPLEPIDGTKTKRSDSLEAHVIQYYNKTGDDIVLLVVDEISKVVCLSGYFNQPIAMRPLI